MHGSAEYNKINWLYNTLYGDLSTEAIKNFSFINIHKDLLESYAGKEISIIDSACGNGIQATALALNGYHVTATDISKEMIKLTAEFAEKNGASLSIDRKAWMELPEKYENCFDIVFCTGNAIVHSSNAEERKNNLQALCQILKAGGTLVIETRNWEKAISEGRKFSICDKLSYGDKEYIPLYHWLINGMEKKAKVEIVFQEIDKNGKVKLYERNLTFTPFSHDSLCGMLKCTDLIIVKDTFNVKNDWYYLYVRRIETNRNM